MYNFAEPFLGWQEMADCTRYRGAPGLVAHAGKIYIFGSNGNISLLLDDCVLTCENYPDFII